MDKMKNRTDSLNPIELKAIPFVKATVLEILRKGNIAPMPGPRTPTKDLKIGEYFIPKGSVLFYNLHVMFNDKMFWEDPESFRPERFINKNGEIDKIRSERILNAVFGVGPRVCFDETVAIDSLFMFLSAMALNFQFDRVPGQALSLDAPHNGLVIAPQVFGVKMKTPSF